jgi:peroxiredoxin Q/BCP
LKFYSLDFIIVIDLTSKNFMELIIMTDSIVDLKVGDPAPDFCLPDKDNKEVCLKDFKGKYVVVYFYPKDNTPGCTTEAIGFTGILPELQKLNSDVIGISPDSPESHTKFIEKKNLKVTLLSDLDKKVIKSYGKWGKKKFKGKEYMGVTRSTFLINPEGKIAHVWPKVSVNGHAEEVKIKLTELMP